MLELRHVLTNSTFQCLDVLAEIWLQIGNKPLNSGFCKQMKTLCQRHKNQKQNPSPGILFCAKYMK